MTATYRRASGGMPCLLRIIWFILVGWWFAGIWVSVAWVLNLSIVGLPIGLAMLNRVPMIMTLQPAREEWLVERDGALARVVERGQVPFVLRAIYFLLIGWWLSLIWCIVAYVLCLSWVGLPIGLLMFNMVGLITTLRRR